ncbi:MAG: chemotaxis protein CheW [Burkholderiaceae bacterium]
MTKVWHKGLPFSAEVAPFLRHMPLVDEHRDGLLRLQGAWDSLALLGQMSGAATDIADTRSAFEALTGTLLDSLARRQLENSLLRMRGKAQVAIDILVRNLFERTADVGFLASDEPLRAHIALASQPAGRVDPADAAQEGVDDSAFERSRVALEARFRAYVAKYSVYDDIIVVSPQGRVLARLDPRVAAPLCSDPLIARALKPGQSFVEHYGATDLLGGREGLIYAAPITAASGQMAVLCLSFKLADEMAGVFRQLLAPGDRSVICLLGAGGQILQSSDGWQFPVGAVLAADAARLVFAGRDYLSVAVPATGYEGYTGPPGWSARVLMPLERAFDDDAQQRLGQELERLAAELDTRDLFDAELRGIPLEAQRIQRDLSRSLWNGKLRAQAQAQGRAESGTFALTLLNEVERTGQQLRQVFEQAIGNLHHTALAAVFDASVFHARLAIDIMDRNLYERANDCRWWALDLGLQQALAGGSPEGAAARLRHINSLYTVYALLLVFDADGRIVAVSDPAQAHRVGTTLTQPWVAATLALRDRERYAVSRHEASGLYGAQGDEASYVYAAALPAPADESRVLGGIAIVFDGRPQFAAMLRDALPQGPGVAGLFLDRSGRVVASTDERWPVGTQGPLDAGLLNLDAGGQQRAELELDGVIHAVGIAMSGGYREYRHGVARSDQDVAAVMLQPLGSRLDQAGAAPASFQPAQDRPQAGDATMLDIASVLVDGQWLGLPARQTVEALERPRITGLPNAPAALIGMLQHQGQMLPVLDLGRLLFGRPSASEQAPVLVCRGEQGQGLALCVQELGQVFSVPAGAAGLSPTRGLVAGGVAPRLLRGAEGSMLSLLTVDELWRQVSGEASLNEATQGLLEA